MRLPHPEQATIDIAKLRDYGLNLLHPEGKHKARVFAAALGISAPDAEKLRDMIFAAIFTNEAIIGHSDEHGSRFVVDFSTQGLRGIVGIRTVWIINRDETAPKLVSCYVKRK